MKQYEKEIFPDLVLSDDYAGIKKSHFQTFKREELENNNILTDKRSGYFIRIIQFEDSSVELTVEPFIGFNSDYNPLIIFDGEVHPLLGQNYTYTITLDEAKEICRLMIEEVGGSAEYLLREGLDSVKLL